MSQQRDKEILAEIADAIQDEPFLNLVAEEVAKLKGIPLTEQMRREIVADLRANTKVEIRDIKDQPQ
jgi:hypothetical protein